MASSDVTDNRQRTLTEKGRDYALQRSFEKRRQLSNKLKNLVTNLSGIFSDTDLQVSIDDFHLDYSNVLNLYEDLVKEHAICQELLPDDQRYEDEINHFKYFDNLVTEFKHRAEIFISSQQTLHSIKPSDSISQIGNRPRQSSVISQASNDGSYLSIARLQDERRRAELEAKTRAFEQEQALTAQRLKLEEAVRNIKIEEHRLKMSTELEAIEARSRVLDNVADGSYVTKYTTHEMKDSENLPRKTPPLNTFGTEGLNHSAAAWSSRADKAFKSENYFGNRDTKPTPHASNDQTHSENQMKNLDRSILTLAHEMRKPVPEINTFSGNIIEYTSFVRQFNARVCATTDSCDERLNYLLQYTSGEAHRIVKGYSYLNAELGFQAAMHELKERYGDPENIALAYVKKALDWPLIKPERSKSLDEFAIFLRECQFAVDNVDAAKILEYSENLRLLLKKLPYYLHDKWRNIVFETKEKGFCIKFSQFVDFVRREAKKANDPTFGRDQSDRTTKAKTEPRNNKSARGNFQNSKSFITQLSNSAHSNKQSEMKENKTYIQNKSLAFISPCLFCNSQSHIFSDCENIVGKDIKDRYSFLKSKGLCFGCLKSGHHRDICRNKLVCLHCKKKHPTILHVAQRNESDDKSISVACKSDIGARKQTLPIVAVRVKHKSSQKYIDTYAFLDSGSTATFCTESLMNRLGVEGQRKTVTLHTIGDDKTDRCFVIKQLELCCLDNSNVIPLPPVLSRKELPVSNADIVNVTDLKEWPYLANVPLLRINSSVDLLIGVNVPTAMEPWEVIPSQNNGPFAIKTVFGWVINGPIEIDQSQFSSHVSVNRVEATLRPTLDEKLQNYFNQDFNEKTVNDTLEPSRAEKQFLDFVENSARLEDGHYVINLPFRDKNVSMPNNKKQAEHRLWLLKKRLNKDERFRREYTDFMQKIIEKGYAKTVSSDDLNQNDGRVWYLPHHGVYHPQKKKLRVVFDCAARYQGTSLNDKLLQGPSLTNSLVGTLLRFREGEIAFMGDIESMFYQVRVPLSDACFLRFLWWQDGDLNKPIVQYQMGVHLFGATSSPSVCNFALRKTASNAKGNFSEEVVDTVMNNFYVDDCLKSVNSVENAKSVMTDLKAVLRSGGFHISKWVSNSRDVMKSISKGDLSSELKNLDLERDSLPIERALGVFWNAELDVFEFKLVLKEKPLTRRGILSLVSSIYDPIGLLSPVVLPAKCLIQESCRLGLGWDDELPEQLKLSWTKWLDEIELVKDFKVARCLKPFDFGEVCEAVLHHFSDASNEGYGVVTYLYLRNFKGECHVSLVTSKSRVAPLKQVTIPRLELTAATVAVRVDSMLKRELSIPIDRSYFWTDSMPVLYYIRNETCRFQTFVANRLTVIHEGSNKSQWLYIPSKLNPADLVSRGCIASAY